MDSTISFNIKPKIVSASSIGGPKECSGSIGKFIQFNLKDDTFGENSYEKAESKMLYTVLDGAMNNAKKSQKDIGAIISGDLLNQIISSTFAVRNFNCSYLGVYSACASFTQGLSMASILVDGNYLDNVLCGTSSHFSSAERQYRYPLELGCTRPPQSQWTVTGAGACLISKDGIGPKITSATLGKIVDYGVVDSNNMGAAMAPAAVETVVSNLNKLKRQPNDYDLIITGDLGSLGSRIFKDLMWERGFDVERQHVDCGELIYNICEEEFQGGSGAGCSSLVFCSYFYKKLLMKEYKRILLVATGALLSSTSAQQGESIPAIAHAVCIES